MLRVVSIAAVLGALVTLAADCDRDGCRTPRRAGYFPQVDHWSPILMSTERERLVRDINGLKERVRLEWLEMISKPMSPAERQELRKSIDSLVHELNNLWMKLDQPPKAEA
jgi:hypothetical protein